MIDIVPLGLFILGAGLLVLPALGFVLDWYSQIQLTYSEETTPMSPDALLF